MIDLSTFGLEAPLGLSLAFDGDARIGDFSFTGPIKPLIDALEPLLGRYRSRPMDHRIREYAYPHTAALADAHTQPDVLA